MIAGARTFGIEDALIACVENAGGTPGVRGEAIEALFTRHRVGTSSQSRALAAVRTALHDSAPEVRSSAVRALTNVGDLADVPSLDRIATEDDAARSDPYSPQREAEGRQHCSWFGGPCALLPADRRNFNNSSDPILTRQTQIGPAGDGKHPCCARIEVRAERRRYQSRR